MPFVANASDFAPDRERLARATAGPALSLVRPASEAEGVAPSSDAGEEMSLGESSNIVGCYIRNTSFVDFPISYQVLLGQFAQPRRRKRINFVVVGSHWS